MGKLTKAQFVMLARLAVGDFVHMLCGVNSHAFFGSDMSTARTSTVEALRTRGLVYGTPGSAIRTREYRITEAGRQALSPSRDGRGGE